MIRPIASLAWPMLVAQLAVMANGVIDTVMAGRLSTVDLAAVAIGSSVYVSVHIGLMGTLQALSPIVAQHFGAGRHAAIGGAWRQTLWLTVAMTLIGSALLTNPEPLLALADAGPEVSDRARLYLQAVAVGLPAALWFRAFTTLNAAVSRPRVVMLINLIGPLLLKVPLNLALMHGWAGLPALGGAGCGVATAIIGWASAAVGWTLLRRDRFYHRFALAGFERPRWAEQRELLRLGIPIGLTYMIEVTSFTFVTLFVGRLGSAVVGGHQIVANLAATAYMLPLALSNATSVLTAQAIGAGDFARAARTAWFGFAIVQTLALAVAATLWLSRESLVAAYTTQPEVQAVALSLIGLVALYHLVDATQCMASFVLRAYRIAIIPMIVYAFALWGVGLGGGWWLAFERGHGAAGFWTAAVASLLLAGGTLLAYFARVAARTSAQREQKP